MSSKRLLNGREKYASPADRIWGLTSFTVLPLVESNVKHVNVITVKSRINA